MTPDESLDHQANTVLRTLGSTRLLTDAMATVTDTYAYDAWGNLMAHNGTTAQPYQFVGRFGYYTDYQDANLMLLQVGLRLYTPATGRFTTEDPARRESNYYAYGANRPTLAVDPVGLAIYFVNPTEYKLCVCVRGGSVFEYGRWCRWETHLRVGSFLKCVGRQCWGTGVRLGTCATLCLPYYLPNAGAYIGCFIHCMGWDQADPSVAADIDAIIECWRQNRYKKKVTKIVMACQDVEDGALYNYLDSEPPTGGGWERCD